MWANGAQGPGRAYAVSQPPAAALVAMASQLRAADNTSRLSQSTFVSPSTPLARSVDALAASVGGSEFRSVHGFLHERGVEPVLNDSVPILSADELTENENARLRMKTAHGSHKTNGMLLVEPLSSALAVVAAKSVLPSQASSPVGTPVRSPAETSDPDADECSVYNVPSFGIGPSQTAALLRDTTVAALYGDSDSDNHLINSDASMKVAPALSNLAAAQDFAVMSMPPAIPTDTGPERVLARVELVPLAELAEAEEAGDIMHDGIQTTTEEERDDVLGSRGSHANSVPMVELQDHKHFSQHPLVQGEAHFVVLSELPPVVVLDASGDASKLSLTQASEQGYVAVAAMPLDVAQNAIAEMRRRGTANVRFLGLLMLLLYTAFNTVQGLVVSVDVNLGTVVFATYYSCFVFSSLFVGAIMQRVSVVWTMRVAFVFFVIFVASLIVPTFVVIVAATAVVGIAAAPMSTAQAMYVGTNSDSTTIAKNNGAFAGIQQNNFILSSLTSALLLSFTSASVSHIFAGATALAFASLVLSKFLRTPAFAIPNEVPSTAEFNREVVMLQVASPVVDEFYDDHRRAVARSSDLNATISARVVVCDDSLTDERSFATVSLAKTHDTAFSLSDTRDTTFSLAETRERFLSLAKTRDTVRSLAETHDTVLSLAETRETVFSLAEPSKGKTSFFPTVKQENWTLLNLHRQRRVFLVIPFWFFTGLFYGLPFGPLPKLLPMEIVGFGLATFGVGSVSSSLLFSHLTGRAMLTSRASVFIGSAFQATCLILSFFASSINESDRTLSIVVVFIAYFVGGFADGGLNPNLLALVPASCPDQRAAGYTLMRIYSSLAMALGNVLMMAGWRTTELAVLGLVWLLFSVVCFTANGPMPIPD